MMPFFKFEWSVVTGDRVRVRVFVGEGDDVTRSNRGTLQFSMTEWVYFREILMVGGLAAHGETPEVVEQK